MRKIFIFIALLLNLSFFLTGCEHYEQEDAERVTEKGTEMMQAWIDENMPDAEITECSAFIQNITYSSHLYLTDYATGRIRLDEEELAFAIDTLTGAVYFENDQRIKLNEVTATYLYEVMGITPESKGYFECYVLAPFHDENYEIKAYQLNYGFDFGLPADIEDLETFVRKPESRPLLYVRTDITLPYDADVAAYDFAAIEKLGEECGMFFGSIHLGNGYQYSYTSTREWITESIFTEYGMLIEKEDFYLYGQVRVREEEYNNLTNGLLRSDRCFDPRQDLVFEETAEGYRYYLPNEDWQEVFTIRAYEGSEMLEYNYIYYFYSDVAGFIAGEFDSDKKEGIETIWQEEDNGSYVLSSKANGNHIYFSHAGELERME